MDQTLPQLPAEIIVSIMQYLKGDDRALNFLARLYGFSHDSAREIVDAFLQRIPYYPITDARIEDLLKLHFNTFSMALHKQVKEYIVPALKHHRNTHPVRTVLHQKDFDQLRKMINFININLFEKTDPMISYTKQEKRAIKNALCTTYKSFSRKQHGSLKDCSEQQLLDHAHDLTRLIEELQVCCTTLTTWQNAYTTKNFYKYFPVFLMPLLALDIALALYLYGSETSVEHPLTFAVGTCLFGGILITSFFYKKLLNHSVFWSIFSSMYLIALRAYCSSQQYSKAHALWPLGVIAFAGTLLFMPVITDEAARRAFIIPPLLNRWSATSYPRLLQSFQELIKDLRRAQENTMAIHTLVQE